MSMFIITLVFMLLVVAAMSLGVILSNKPIKGSCGGMSAIGMDTVCDICGGDTNKCDEEQERNKANTSSEDLSYDAGSND